MPKLSFQYVRQEAPETLLEFLARRFKYHTILEWENLVVDGHVKVNGRRVSPNLLLETRHKILYERPPFKEPPVDENYRVLYEDAHLLAVSKSGNMPTSPSGKYWEHCLVHYLMRERKLPELHAAHRLDRETSGINLFAKSRQAARLLGKGFQTGQMEKTYSAILRGHLEKQETTVTAPLRNAVQGDIRIRQEVHPEGRPCETRFSLLAYLPKASLVEIRPMTGRTHQIRAHAHHLGHPVIGDKLYGVPEAEFIHWVAHGERNSHDRQLLHASKLEFTHPIDGQTITLQDSPEVLMDLFLGRERQKQ